MRQTLKLWILAAILVCGAVSAQAQIDPKVTEVLRKSEAAMSNPQGIEMTMTIDVRMLVKLSGSSLTVAQKGNKERATVVIKVLGKEMTIEHGFDGTQQWTYKHMAITEKDKDRKDTLTIESVAKKPKSESNIDFDLDKSYKTATAKLNGQNYELTFTNPLKKDDPKKTVMKIDKDKFYVREVKVKEGATTMTMTVTSIKIGVSDNVFKLNLNDYPGAVVVRK